MKQHCTNLTGDQLFPPGEQRGKHVFVERGLRREQQQLHEVRAMLAADRARLHGGRDDDALVQRADGGFARTDIDHDGGNGRVQFDGERLGLVGEAVEVLERRMQRLVGVRSQRRFAVKTRLGAAQPLEQAFGDEAQIGPGETHFGGEDDLDLLVVHVLEAQAAENAVVQQHQETHAMPNPAVHQHGLLRQPPAQARVRVVVQDVLGVVAHKHARFAERFVHGVGIASDPAHEVVPVPVVTGDGHVRRARETQLEARVFRAPHAEARLVRADLDVQQRAVFRVVEDQPRGVLFVLFGRFRAHVPPAWRLVQRRLEHLRRGEEARRAEGPRQQRDLGPGPGFGCEQRARRCDAAGVGVHHGRVGGS